MRKKIPIEQFFWRSIKATAAMGVLAALFVNQYGGPIAAAWYLLALVWMLVNLVLLALLLREFAGQRRQFPLLALASAKLLWLGLICGMAIAAPRLHARPGAFSALPSQALYLAFLGGITTPFLVILLQALGLAWFQRRKATEAQK